MARSLNSVLTIMRTVLGRNNLNDPNSSTPLLIQYIQDFINLTMSDDVKVFENFGTLTFNIDETNASGVYSLDGPPVNGTEFFINYSAEVFLSNNDPVNSSTVWNQIELYQDPGRFFAYWGVNNYNILIKGMPTEMLYYGREFTFRTIPNTQYTVTIFAYRRMQELDTTGDPDISEDYWLRYIAYGAAKNYAMDYRYDEAQLSRIERGFSHERKQLLTRTHNQIKQSRCVPQF